MNTMEQTREEVRRKNAECRKEIEQFEQLPRESNKAFAAFKTYLDLGPDRSHVLVAEKIGVSKRMVHKWSAKYGWVERVAARDAYIAEVERLAIERVAVENAVEWWKLHEPTRREAWQEAEATIAMVRKAREEWMAKGRLPGWEGMARMLELAFKLKQFATGMPSEIKEVHNLHAGKVSIEWEEAIRKAYGGKAESEKCEPHGPLKAETIVDVETVPATQPSSAVPAPSPAPASEGHAEVKP
ncbi:MAG TPA: hypothetical protein VK327_18935 [Candidatus Paceibacterota bacterium]|nr:hypothetical protein [Candidatus Paceibacterota bacterium]